MRNVIKYIKSNAILSRLSGLIIMALAIYMELSLYSLIKYFDDKNMVTVSGIVYAKGTEQKRHKYYTSDNWVMAVRPFDKKYKPYSVTVDFATYASFNVGDKIAFKVDKYKVLSNYSSFNIIFIATVLTILSMAIIAIAGTFISFKILIFGYNE